MLRSGAFTTHGAPSTILLRQLFRPSSRHLFYHRRRNLNERVDLSPARQADAMFSCWSKDPFQKPGRLEFAVPQKQILSRFWIW